MIKAVFFDIDDTIFSHTLKDIPESTKIAIDKLREKGIQCVIATGRHMSEIKDLPVHEIEFDGYITLNGQLCLNSKKEVLYGNPIDKKDKAYLLKLFEEKDIPISLVDQDDMYISYINDTVIKVQNEITTPLPPVYEYQNKEIYLAVAYTNTDHDDDLMKNLPDCKLFRWNPYATDIFSKTGDKVEGIKHYLALNHLNRDEIIAFGDGENDMEMLRYAGIGIAMGNGHEGAKQVSDYVTDSIDHDGVYKALQHFEIID